MAWVFSIWPPGFAASYACTWCACLSVSAPALPSTWDALPCHLHAAFSSRACWKVSEISPRFTPSLSRLVVCCVAPGGCGLVSTELICT